VVHQFHDKNPGNGACYISSSLVVLRFSQEGSQCDASHENFKQLRKAWVGQCHHLNFLAASVARGLDSTSASFQANVVFSWKGLKNGDPLDVYGVTN
jgi:hypothetical protein